MLGRAISLCSLALALFFGLLAVGAALSLRAVFGPTTRRTVAGA